MRGISCRNFHEVEEISCLRTPCRRDEQVGLVVIATPIERFALSLLSRTLENLCTVRDKRPFFWRRMWRDCPDGSVMNGEHLGVSTQTPPGPGTHRTPERFSRVLTLMC